MSDPWAAFPDAPAAPPAPSADPWAAFPDASAQAAPAAAVVAPDDVRGPNGVPGGIPSKPVPPETFSQKLGDAAVQTSAGVLGAPVDVVNAIMRKVGAPSSDTPFLGSRSIAGVMQSTTGSQENRDIAATKPDLLHSSGAPVSERVYSSFLNTPAAKERYVSEKYGPEGKGWYKMADRFGNPTDRIVVRNSDGSEHLFNPPGIDRGDIAGMVGGVPDLIGAVMGSAASVPAYALGPAVGIPASAVASAGGAQLVGETVGRLFPENREAEPSVAKDVLPRATREGISDALLGAIMGTGARAINGVANIARAPFASSASDPMAVEFRDAADRLKKQGYDIAPMASESGAGGFIPRTEGLLAKLPGSSEKMRQYREGGDAAISRFQGDVAGSGDASEAGRSVASEMETRRKNLIIDREEALRRADDATAANEAALTSRQGPDMSAEAAGQQTRGGLERARQEFRGEAKRLYDIARAAPGGTGPIVDMTPVRGQVKKIRAALPPSAEGNPSSEFIPQGLNRLLGGVDDIADNVSLDHARQMRTLVTDAINDKSIMPGVPERYLVQLRQSLSSAIEGSVNRVADPQLKQALSAANSYYRDNIDRFSRKGIAEVYRGPTSAGYVEDNGLVSRLLSGHGKPGVIRETRDLMGANSPEWAATRRNAVEQILDVGRSPTLYGRRVVNVDGLVSKLNSLDDETVKELFGVSDAGQLRNLASDISNRTKYLDADKLSANGTPNILGQLRAAAVADQQIGHEYRDNVIAPFLRGEDGARAKMKPEELVPWLYRKASPDDAKAIMGRLDPAMRDNVERGVVADVIENAISKGRGDLSSVRRLVTGQADPANSQGIAEILGAGGDVPSRQQAARVAVLVSPENRQALRDLALITARRQERDATTSAIGGLAAGAAITGILSKPGKAFQTAIVARGLAQLITSPTFRNWVTNTNRLEMNPVRQAQVIAAAPSLAHVATGAIGENQDVQTALDWLREGVSQIDKTGRRIVRPPAGAGSWEDFFSKGRRNQ